MVTKTNLVSSATIADVAERAGVSQMTVSRVLNDNAAVRSTTADRVRQAIKDLNYRPSRMARGLAGRAPLILGLIHDHARAGYLSEFLLSTLEVCREKGFFLIVEEPILELSSCSAELLQQRAIRAGLDGVVVVPPLSNNPRFIDMLSHTHVPFVCVGTQLEAENYSSIQFDQRAAATCITRHLIELGHEHIGFVGGDEHLSTTKQRLLGFADAMRDAGHSVARSLIKFGDFSFESGVVACRALLSQNCYPTAIIVCNDDMSAGVIHALREANLRVPTDVSVAGFDDTKRAEIISPPLTTIKEPIDQIARLAVEMIQEVRHANSLGFRTANADFELIVRSSTAPPVRRASTRNLRPSSNYTCQTPESGC